MRWMGKPKLLASSGVPYKASSPNTYIITGDAGNVEVLRAPDDGCAEPALSMVRRPFCCLQHRNVFKYTCSFSKHV